MLTEAEKKWLGNREFANAVNYGAYSCPSCWWLNKELEECILRRCLRFDPDYQDAAEFEARVAAKLATMTCDRFCPAALNNRVCRRAWADRRPMYECRLKRARLAVEAEMEENNE